MLHLGCFSSPRSPSGIQVTKIRPFYSETLQITYGVAQRWILGPLLFNVNLMDLFVAEHCKSNFPNCADYTTPYNRRDTFLKTISDLEIIDNQFNWLCYNNFQANPSKCKNVIYSYHLLIQSSLRLKFL